MNGVVLMRNENDNEELRATSAASQRSTTCAMSTEPLQSRISQFVGLLQTRTVCLDPMRCGFIVLLMLTALVFVFFLLSAAVGVLRAVQTCVSAICGIGVGHVVRSNIWELV
jgi:hypothetical protein